MSEEVCKQPYVNAISSNAFHVLLIKRVHLGHLKNRFYGAHPRLQAT